KSGEQITVIVQTPLKRDGRHVPPNARIDLPLDEAALLLAVQAVRVSDPTGAGGESVSNPADADTSGAQLDGGLVNINVATAEQIAAAAKGIGIRTARDVVQWRKAGGSFASLDDLAKVSGIGKATVERNRDVLTV